MILSRCVSERWQRSSSDSQNPTEQDLTGRLICQACSWNWKSDPRSVAGTD